MSDDLTPEEESEQPLAGMRLAAARRALDISVFDIAKEMHLDEPKVRALEDNDFDVLGAPVFAKGHLKKYAELVGVGTDDVLADYYSLNRGVGAPPVVGLSNQSPPREFNLGRWVAGFFVVAALATVAFGGYWWLEHRADSAAVDLDAPQLAPFVSASAEGGDGEEVNADPEMIPEAAATTDSSVVPEDAGDADPPPGLATTEPTTVSTFGEPPGTQTDIPQVTLHISFSGDCWTEVSDASGKRLYFELGTEGRNVSVSGAAPLHALFGDSRNVRLTVNGQDYPITASMRSGRTARMTINAQ